MDASRNEYQKLHMDNAGENIQLELRLKNSAWNNPVAIEYTTRDTPQQNLPVEVGFYALPNKAFVQPCIKQTY